MLNHKPESSTRNPNPEPRVSSSLLYDVYRNYELDPPASYGKCPTLGSLFDAFRSHQCRVLNR